MMNRTVSLGMLAASVALPAGADAATRSKHQYVQIQVDAPDSALCRETARAVALLRDEIGWTMIELYGHGEGHPDRTVGKIVFHGVHVQSIVFANGAGQKRTLPLAFYLADIDNTPPVEMIDFVTGGHMATGGGTTLFILRTNLSAAPAPVPDTEIRNAAMQIGPLDVSFTGKDFDAGYYSYPFAFAGRNYLFIEGNGEEYRPPEDQKRDPEGARKHAKDAVVELVPNVGLVTRCYFAEEPAEPAK